MDTIIVVAYGSGTCFLDSVAPSTANTEYRRGGEASTMASTAGGKYGMKWHC